MAASAMLFNERIRRRKALWAAKRFWQRGLANKLTAKLFALRNGVPVPKMYWAGDQYREWPPKNLPDTFVLKPFHGHSAVGVIPVERGINHRNGQPIDWQQVREDYEAHRDGALIEEYVPSSSGRYDIVEGFKIFVFGPECIIRYNQERFDTVTGEIRCQFETYCRDNWTPIEERLSYYAPPGPPPPSIRYADELLDYARRLGEAYETFVRVDFFVGLDGPRFGEFCPFPYEGKYWTKFANELFDSLWERHLGKAP